MTWEADLVLLFHENKDMHHIDVYMKNGEMFQFREKAE